MEVARYPGANAESKPRGRRQERLKGMFPSPRRDAMYNKRRRSMREYDPTAYWYATESPGRTVGVAEALAVDAMLPANSRILDVGCGNGVPISQALVNAGHRVVGLDSSAGMLAHFQVNLPGTPVVR